MRYYVINCKTPKGRDEVFERIRDLEHVIKLINTFSGWQIVSIGVRYYE